MPTNLPMFNTWKYGPEGKVENLKTSHDYETARSSQHQACNRCHEKKLKCSGEKDGCDRCSTHGLSCEYSRSGSRHSKKGKSKSDRHSSCSSRSGRDGSGSPKTSHSSKHKEHKSSRNSYQIHEESFAGSGGMSRTVSGHADYGMDSTYDGYEFLAATGASQSSGYPATSTSMADYNTAGVGNYGGQWVLPPGTNTAGMTSSFMPTSGSVYTDDGSAYANYSAQADYDVDIYQGVDPRFWDRNQGQH